MQPRKVLYEDFDFIYTKSYGKESENITWQELEFNRDKKEYVDKDQAKSYFQSEVNFIQAITSKKLHICFFVSVTLKMRYWVRMDDGYPAYWQSYEDDNGCWIENDHPAQEYGFTLFESLHDFDGYISPVKYKNFLKGLLKDSEDKILLEKVFLIELFNDNRRAKLYEGKQYFIDSKESIMTEVKISDAMFLKSELECIQNNTLNYENVSALTISNNDIQSQELTENLVEMDEVFQLKEITKKEIELSEDKEISRFFAQNGEYADDDIDKRIKLFLLNLRKIHSNRLVDNTKTTAIYKVVPDLIIKLGHRLDALPENKAGNMGLRSDVKSYMKKNNLNLYKEIVGNENTFNQNWSNLMKDIKKIKK